MHCAIINERRGYGCAIAALTYPCRDEDEIHLEEGEDGVQDGIGSALQREARRIGRHLHEGAKLEAVVDERTQTKCYHSK